MKAKKLIISLVGGLLLLVFLSLMFTFTVRNTEIALVSSWRGKKIIIYGSQAMRGDGNGTVDPGFQLRLPWPFQQVHKLDGRVHILESNQAQLAGAGGGEVMASIYVGWQVGDAEKFRRTYESAGSVEKMMAQAQGDLGNAVDAIRGEVFGDVKVLDLLAPAQDGKDEFSKLEDQMRYRLHDDLLNQYGIKIKFVGIKRISLSPTVANSLVEGMVTAKETRVSNIKRETEAKIQGMRDDSEKDFQAAIDEAERNADRIKQQAESEASAKYEEMERKHPRLAIALKTIQALQVLGETQSTIFLTDKSPIMHLLTGSGFPLLKLPLDANGTANGNNATNQD